MATRLTPAKRKAEALALLESPEISALFEKVRLTAVPPPQVPTRRSALPAAIGVGLLCAVSWWCFSGPRCGLLRATLPGGSHGASTAIGDTCLYRGDFYPSANVETLRQLEILKSGPSHAGNSALAARGIAFVVLTNVFTAAFDSYYAPLALNLVLSWLGAWLVARATGVLFRDPTKSMLAASCFGLSIVLTACVGEVGPRLLGVCLSYLWTLLLLQKDAEDAPIGWRGGIGLAALLGFWSLVDISSLAGLIVYAVFGFKRRKPIPVIFAALCWAALPIGQELVWRRLGFAVSPTTDFVQIWTALGRHASRLAAEPLGYLGFLTIELGNLIVDENPLMVVGCLFGLGLINHKSKGLLRVCFLAPIVVQVVLLPVTRLRGAAVAGNTIVLLALTSHYAVEAGRRLQARFGPEAFAVPLVGLAVALGAWGYAGLCGWDFPVKAFETGVFREVGTVLPTKFTRLAGSPQEMPTVLGGPVRAPRFARLAEDSGRPPLLPTNRVVAYRENWSRLPELERLLAVQAPAFIALLISAVCLMRIWRGLGLSFLITGGVAAALLCGSATGFAERSFASFDKQISIGSDEKLNGSVRLSPEFLARLQDAVDQGEQVEFFVRATPVNARAEHAAEFQVAEWSSPENRITVPAQAALDAFRACGGRVEFSITAPFASRGLLLHSWQATRSNGERAAQLVRADGKKEPLDRFPSFEIRIIRPTSNFAFQKLLDRFDGQESVRYAVVGF